MCGMEVRGAKHSSLMLSHSAPKEDLEGLAKIYGTAPRLHSFYAPIRYH